MTRRRASAAERARSSVRAAVERDGELRRASWSPRAVAAGALVAWLTVAPPATPAQPTDHFTCYKTAATAGAPRFAAIPGVSLRDQFGTATVEVRRPERLCTPTNKNGEDPSAPSHPDHLQGYKIKPALRLVRVPNQKVVDQFGTIFVDVIKTVSLLVPSAKGLTATPPEPTDPAVDHFQCHKVRHTAGTPRFVPVAGVTIEDQFGTRSVEVKAPQRLCAPVDKNGEEPGAETHPDHLMCYRVKETSEPRFATVSPLFLNNQFGPTSVAARRPAELCVPALKNPQPSPTPTIAPAPTPTASTTPVAVCGNGMVDLPLEQCDPSAPPGGGAVCHPSTCVPLGAGAGDAFACTCATGQLRAIRDSSEVDNGWTGTAHNAASVVGTDADTLLFDCDGVIDPVCRISAPRAGRFGFRCELNSRTHCSSDADCAPLDGRCGAFIGPPLPLSSGGVPTCVLTFFARPATGTVNVQDGSVESSSFFLSRVHTSPAIDAPCPRCNCTGPDCTNQIGDAGTCSGGAAAGQACTIEGTTGFGPMSRDCPPLAGANVSGGGLDIRFLPTTTGQSTKDATLPCRASGFTQFLCPCDTCGGGSTPGAPCAGDADCNGGVCGATRCVGGDNDGALCTANSECPGTPAGTCTRPGAATKPNDCDRTCAGGSTPGAPCANDGECSEGTCVPLCEQIAGLQTGMGECPIGPSEGHCSSEPFRSCNVNAECNATTCIPPGACPGCTLCGQTCEFSLRPCHVFPIELQGDPNPFVLNDSNGTTVNTYCIPPTTSPAVNTSAGLPGEGAIIIQHHYTKKFPPDVCGNTCP